MPYSPDPNRYGAVNEVIHHPETQTPAFTGGGSVYVLMWDPYTQYILPTELEDRLAELAGGSGGVNEEQVRDIIGATLSGADGIMVLYDDPGNVVTIGVSSFAIDQVTGLQAAIDNAKSRATHTGTQAQSTVTNLVTDLASKLAKSSNLSDLPSISTARSNLGLGSAALVNTGTTNGTVPLLSTGGVLPISRIATGTPTGTKFVRDDGTLAVPAGGGGGSLQEDLADPGTYLVSGSEIQEDLADPGTYLIGA